MHSGLLRFWLIVSSLLILLAAASYFLFGLQSILDVILVWFAVTATIMAAAFIYDEKSDNYNPRMHRGPPPTEWPVQVGIFRRTTMGELVDSWKKNRARSRLRPRQLRGWSSAGFHFVEVEFAEYIGKYKVPKKR
jgi:hypothetical protein